MPSALAFRYARALADVAGKPGSGADVAAVRGELEAFEIVLTASPALRNALESPAVTPPKKRAVVTELARRLQLSDVTKRFLYVLIDRRRVGALSEIREAYELVEDERLGIVRADVGSARELTPAQRKQLIDELARLTGKQVRARFSVHGELIGGVMARIGSTIYDGSIRGQLQTIKYKLAGAGS